LEVDGRHDPVLATRQPPQHVPGAGLVGRLAENGIVDEDESVRGEDPVAGVAGGRHGGLLAGEPLGRLRTRFAGGDRLLNVGRTDRERDAEVREDLGATGRGGGENERRYG
jgi:hypothetical protein